MNPTSFLADIRKEYTRQDLSFEKTAPDPFTQFNHWFEEALASKVPEPNAMHLCTVSADGRPSGRIVLLKGLDTQGFVFYTNYQSRKGNEMAQNSWVSLALRVYIQQQPVVTLYALDKQMQDRTGEDGKLLVHKFKMEMSFEELFSMFRNFNFTVTTGQYNIEQMEVINLSH